MKLFNKIGLHNNILALPVSLTIEPNNTCNLHCPLCPTGSGKMNRPPRMMTFNEFKRIIDQVKRYIINISLYEYGEPFINNDLLNMISYAREAGIIVNISTNGTFFKSLEFCKKVIKSGLNRLIICLDGADQDTISIYRKGIRFDDVIAGYKLLRQAKEDLRSETPIIEMQMIIMKHNQHQKEIIRKMAEELKVDFFCEKTVKLDYNDRNFQIIAEKYLPADLSDSRYEIDLLGNFYLKNTIRNKCDIIFKSAVINSDGSVIPCCYDYNFKFIMGNAFEEDIKEIWKNDKYQKFRKQVIVSRDRIPMCNICSEGRTNIYTQYIVNKR